ncbi:hypothetical protein EC913_1451 [Pseudomonas sp. LP_4_YM]|nr:hypothetical protein EC913_1451 [Pseudomonas sp. LP_4_YM]
MLLAPLLHFDHIVRPRGRLDFEGVGCQLYLHAVRAELSHGTRVTLLPCHGKFEAIETCQALATLDIMHEGNTFERDGVIEQLKVKLCAMLFDCGFR